MSVSSLSFKLISLVLVSSVFVVIFSFFDHTHFNGIEEESDQGYDKILNRLYFVLTSLSTIGYGDISPKTQPCRYVTILLQAFVCIEFISSFLYWKKKSE